MQITKQKWNSWSLQISKTYAIDLDFLYGFDGWKNFEFINLVCELKTDKNEDHNPTFWFWLNLLNFGIIDFSFYNIFSKEKSVYSHPDSR